MSSRLIFRPRYRNSIIDQQYAPVSLGTQGAPAFLFSRARFISARRLAATSAPREPATHPQPPSATAPHRLPVPWLVPRLAATTRISREKDAFGPASILAHRR